MVERRWEDLGPDERVRVGEQVRVVVFAESKAHATFILLEAPIPAGTEPVEDDSRDAEAWEDSSVELRDDRAAMALQAMEEGARRELTFRVRATTPGTYRALPATAFEMYDPDRRGESEEFVLRITE
jgi:hypothetical protein